MAADNAEKELMIHTHCRRGDREKEEGVREEGRVDNTMGDRSGTQKEWRRAKSNGWDSCSNMYLFIGSYTLILAQTDSRVCYKCRNEKVLPMPCHVLLLNTDFTFLHQATKYFRGYSPMWFVQYVLKCAR